MPFKIKCKDAAGFRRCGVLFPKGETVYPDDTFTPEQIDILKNEKHLAVEIIPEEKQSPVLWGTVGELKAMLHDMGIEYPTDAKKADLISLIESQSPGNEV